MLTLNRSEVYYLFYLSFISIIIPFQVKPLPTGLDCFLPRLHLSQIAIEIPLSILDTINNITGIMISETSSRLNSMKNDSLYTKLLNDVKDDLLTSSSLLLLESEGLCILNNISTPLSTTTVHQTNAINNTKGQGNFIENLTTAWRSHAAIGLGVQTFGRLNTHKSISKHLGKAISRLTNDLAKSQDLIAHFLTFNSASNHLSKHIQTLTKGSKSTQLSSFISSKIKQSLLNKLDLDLNTNRKTRVLNRIINKSDFKAQFKTSITNECHTDNSALECGCMTLKVTINIYLPKN